MNDKNFSNNSSNFSNNFSEDDWIFDPSMASIQRSLEREIREEAQEVESIVTESELRSRTMAEVVHEIRNLGKVVSVTTQRRTFKGMVLYAAKDFITVRTESFEVDIQLLAILAINTVDAIDKKPAGGLPTTGGPGTFEMRMIERRSPYELMEIGYIGTDTTVTGKLTAVGQDHVIITDDLRREHYIPLTSIAYAIRVNRRSR